MCAIIPIYCINSFFAVFIESIGFYADTLKEMYEGFVIYNFLMMCLASVGYDSDLVNFWNRSGNPPLPSSWLWSTCCCGHVPLDHRFLVRCKQGVLQFVVVKLVMAVVILLCNELGAADAAWIYIFIIYNVAYTVALYALFAFYLGTKELLQPFKPVMKFVMVKAIIFVTFWQSIAVSACISNGLISFVETPEYSRDRFQKRLQNFFIVVEVRLMCMGGSLSWREVCFLSYLARSHVCFSPVGAGGAPELALFPAARLSRRAAHAVCAAANAVRRVAVSLALGARRV